MSNVTTTIARSEMLTLSILKQISLRQVATWIPETESWSITQPRATVSSAGAIETYVTGLKDESHQATMKSFIDMPGAMALFELELLGQRKVMGVKLFRFRTIPVLFHEPLTDDTTFLELARVHPLLKMCFSIRRYDWDTPSFREACAALKLNPDEGRPRFRAPYQPLAQDLLQAMADHFEALHPNYHSREAVLALLDLMRADQQPNLRLLEDARRHWLDIDPSLIPHVDMLTQLLKTDRLLSTEVG